MAACLQVWDVGTLQCVKTLEGHDDNVRVLAVSDRYMFSGSWDKSIRVRGRACFLRLRATDPDVGMDAYVGAWACMPLRLGATGPARDACNRLCER